MGGVNSPGPSPIFNLGWTNGIQAYRTTLCHCIIMNQAPKQLGFISGACSRANSSFGVRMYVSTLVCTGDAREMHTRACVLSLGWEDMGVVVKLEEWTLVVVGLADNAGVGLVDAGVNIVKEVPE